ncbi:MAG TPA: glycosyltransferase family 2 protein [Polyangia bacterium]|nr:glycosyltransferase family 2 protein [Polyangia bacterium]
MRVAVVIPAYDASRHVAAVIERVLAAPVRDLDRVIVVNDGSRDDTARIVAELPRGRCPVELVDRPRNGGYGAAMKDGLARAAETDPDVVACVHADGQYSPEALPSLLDAMQVGGLDLLQGSRIASGSALSGGMPIYKYVANAALNVLENLALGLRMTDYHSGYLLYGRRLRERVPFARLSDSFDFDLEVIASARACGLAVAEAPVPTRYADEISHLRPIPYGLRVLRVLWRFRRGHYAPS